MKYSPIINISSLLILSACTVGPDFLRPETPALQSYNAEGDAFLAGDQHMEAREKTEGSWWTLFGCEPLNTVIEAALANNKGVAASKATLAQAQEMVKAESGALWPQIEMDGTAGRQKYGAALFGPSNIQIPPFTYYEVGPSVSLPLDIFGGEKRSIERQQALAEYQAYELNAVYLSLIGDVVAGSLSIAALRAQIAASEEIISIDEKYLLLIRNAYGVGAAAKKDILAAQSQLENDRSQLPSLRQQLSVIRNTLSILAGKAPADWAPPEFDLEQFTLPQELPLTLPSELVHQRPDILAAEANLHAASAAIGIAIANFYPQITLTANFTQQALTPRRIFNAANDAWSLASGITAPLFKGGILDAEKHKAEKAYQAALAAYEQTILKAFADVANNLKALEHNEEACSLQKKVLDIAQNTLQLAQRAHEAGGIGILKIYEARRQYQQATLAYIRSRAQRYQDTARFFVVLGHL